MQKKSPVYRPASQNGALFVALSLLGAMACERAPQNETTPIASELSTSQSAAAQAEERTAAPPIDSPPQKPALIEREPAPTSPFLVGSPSPPPQPQAFAAPLPPPPTRTTQAPPPPPPQPWPPVTNTNTQMCGPDRCFHNGRCVIPGGPIAGPHMPPGAVSGLCGRGGKCSPCRCVSPGTPIATPQGDAPIESLKRGDEVFSVQDGKVVVVPVLATQRVAVQNHAIARLRLNSGALIEISGEHPLADGRALFDLRPGDRMGELMVEALTLLPYEYPATYDILPDSETGIYWVKGLWLGSTIPGRHSF